MKIQIEYYIDKTVLELSAIDLELIEQHRASQQLADKLTKHFPSKKLNYEEKKERGIYKAHLTEFYLNELWVYDRGQVEAMLGELRVLLQSTHSRKAIEILTHIKQILLT